MTVSDAAAQSKTTMVAVIFSTALVRIPFAGFSGYPVEQATDRYIIRHERALMARELARVLPWQS